MKPRYYWIKERHNPQLGVYYVACGNLSIKDAMKMEGGSYGHNIMIKFPSETAYNNALQMLKDRGERVH